MKILPYNSSGMENRRSYFSSIKAGQETNLFPQLITNLSVAFILNGFFLLNMGRSLKVLQFWLVL